MLYQGYQQLLVEKQEKILLVKINNVAKKNSLNGVAYLEITRVLREVNQDDNVTIILFTGVGDFFSAGNDLTRSDPVTDIDEYLKESNRNLINMIESFIDCKKIIFMLVNGPAIGIGATIVGLADVAWCTESAYFLTPFTKLGIVMEGASSYLLSRTVGRSKGSEMLLLSEPLSSKEAYHFGFVSRIYKTNELDSVVWPKLRSYSELPPNSLRETKRLLRSQERDFMLRANIAECKELLNRFKSDEFIDALIKFSSRKNSSKL